MKILQSFFINQKSERIDYATLFLTASERVYYIHQTNVWIHAHGRVLHRDARDDWAKISRDMIRSVHNKIESNLIEYDCIFWSLM